MNEEELKKVEAIVNTYSKSVTKGSERYFKMQIGRNNVRIEKYENDIEAISSELDEKKEEVQKLEEKKKNSSLTPDEQKALDDAKNDIESCKKKLQELKKRLENIKEKVAELKEEHEQMKDSLEEAIGELKKNPVFEEFIKEEYAKSYDKRMAEVEKRKEQRVADVQTIEKIQFFAKKDENFSKNMDLAVKQGAQLRSLKAKKIELEDEIKAIEDQKSPEYKQKKAELDKLGNIIYANEQNTEIAYQQAYSDFAAKIPEAGKAGHVSQQDFYKVIGDMAEHTNPQKKSVKLDKIVKKTKEGYEKEDKEDDEKLLSLTEKYKEQDVVLEASEVESKMGQSVRDSIIENKTAEIDDQIRKLKVDQHRAEQVDASEIVKKAAKKTKKLEKLRAKIEKSSDDTSLIPYEKQSFFQKIKSRINKSRRDKVSKLAKEINSLNEEYDQIYSDEARENMEAEITKLEGQKKELGNKSITDDFRKEIAVKGIDSKNIVKVVTEIDERKATKEEQEADGQEK
ncbi:MAG: hypothetical protein J6J36_02305 [Clostridia bacterium]|nr:hypothetical protein [Clostridia bacterium]